MSAEAPVIRGLCFSLRGFGIHAEFGLARMSWRCRSEYDRFSGRYGDNRNKWRQQNMSFRGRSRRIRSL